MKQAPNLSTDLFDDAPTQQRPRLAELSDQPNSGDFMDDLNEEEPMRAKAPPPPPRAK